MLSLLLEDGGRPKLCTVSLVMAGLIKRHSLHVERSNPINVHVMKSEETLSMKTDYS